MNMFSSDFNAHKNCEMYASVEFSPIVNTYYIQQILYTIFLPKVFLIFFNDCQDILNMTYKI